jgi:hypothetical protein
VQGPLHPNSITLIYKRLIRAAFDKKLLGEMSEAERGRWRHLKLCTLNNDFPDIM